MEYEISLSEDGHYIIVKYIGNIDGEIALKATVESNVFAKELGVLRILVDVVESRNFESTIKNYDFAYEELGAKEINRQMVVALLVDPDDHSHDFIETVTRNSGHNLTLFRDREQAINHLLESGNS